MTTHEERQELMGIARQVITELTAANAQMHALNERVHITINKLIGEADALKLQAADEISAGTQATVRKVKFSSPANAEKFPEKTAVIIDSPTLLAGKLLHEIAEKALTQVRVAPGKRACSLCREPGHRAQNCPNAHTIRDAKKAEVEARPVKRTRAPMTAARRAQLVETLKKARAAKKKS